MRQFSPKSTNNRMQKIIESSGISKNFGSTKALSDISFTVNESEVFGFIGPDGAGKTTLFRIITTLMLPHEGEIKVLVSNVSTHVKARGAGGKALLANTVVKVLKRIGEDVFEVDVIETDK